MKTIIKIALMTIIFSSCKKNDTPAIPERIRFKITANNVYSCSWGVSINNEDVNEKNYLQGNISLDTIFMVTPPNSIGCCLNFNKSDKSGNKGLIEIFKNDVIIDSLAINSAINYGYPIK